MVSSAAVEPFADLAMSMVALEDGDAHAALGYALAAGLGRPALMLTATSIAKRAEGTHTRYLVALDQQIDTNSKF